MLIRLVTFYYLSLIMHLNALIRFSFKSECKKFVMQCLGFSGATEGIHTDITYLLTFEVKKKHNIVDDNCILIDVTKINFYPYTISCNQAMNLVSLHVVVRVFFCHGLLKN